MRRSSKRLGHVLESYGQATMQREPRASAANPGPRLISARPPVAADPDAAAHEAYRKGVAGQAAAYLAELQAGERVLMHFEYHTLSPVDGGPRDIDDIGVHLTVAESLPEPVRLRPVPVGDARR